LQASSF